MSPSNETPSTAPPQPERFVYIVDDDEAVRDSLRWLLEGSGFNVRTFHSAESFLNAYTPGHFAVLILDVRMGGMSGIELAAEIRDRDPHMPVLILTGHADAMQIPEDLPVLAKPFRSADLAARVATLLEGAVGTSV